MEPKGSVLAVLRRVLSLIGLFFRSGCAGGDGGC